MDALSVGSAATIGLEELKEETTAASGGVAHTELAPTEVEELEESERKQSQDELYLPANNTMDDNDDDPSPTPLPPTRLCSVLEETEDSFTQQKQDEMGRDDSPTLEEEKNDLMEEDNDDNSPTPVPPENNNISQTQVIASSSSQTLSQSSIEEEEESDDDNDAVMEAMKQVQNNLIEESATQDDGNNDEEESEEKKPEPLSCDSSRGLHVLPIGRADIAITPDGKTIIVVGDYYLKGYNSSTNSVEFDVKLKQQVTSVAVHPTEATVALGFVNGDACLHAYPSGELISALARAPGPIRSVAFSPNGQEVGIGMTENVVKIVDIQDTTKISDLTGFNAPIRSISFDPKGEFIATTSFDGCLRVFSRSGSECVHTLEGALEEDFTDDITDTQRGQLGWSPDGKFLAVPGKPKVLVLDRSNWAKSTEFFVSQDKACTIATYSPNGVYLACTAEDGRIVVWSTLEKTLVSEFHAQEPLVAQCLEWSPTKNQIVSFTVEGDFQIQNGVIPSGKTKPFEAPQPITKTTTQAADNDNLFDDDEDELNAEEMMEVIKYDEANPDEDTSSSALIDQKQIDARITQVLRETLPKKPVRQPSFQPGNCQPSDADERRFMAWSSIGRILVRSEDGDSHIEVEFNDSAKYRNTRFTDSYGFNIAALSETGVVFASTGEFGSAEVTDSEDWDPPELDMSTLGGNVEQGQSLQELMEKAELQERGLVPGNEEAEMDDAAKLTRRIQERMALYGNESVLFYRPNGSTGNDWTLSFPAKEKIRCVASGHSFCAAATNRRILRVIRPSGLQEAPIVLPGPVVTLAAASTLLFVAYHITEPSDNGTQNIGFALYDVGPSTLPGGGIAREIKSGRIPLPLRDTNPLKWVGFTDKSMGYMAVCMDSKGMVMGLSQSMSWNWVPLLDTTTLPDAAVQRLWPISVQLNKMMAVGLRGVQTYPRTLPRPTVLSFNLQIPIIGLHGEAGRLKYKLEESSVRGSMIFEQLKWSVPCQESSPFRLDDMDKIAKQEAQLDLEIIKHLVLAIKLKNMHRAFGLIKRLRRSASFDFAYQAAARENCDPNLLEKIHQLKERREREEEEEEEDVEDDSSDDESQDGDNHVARSRKVDNIGNDNDDNEENIASDDDGDIDMLVSPSPKKKLSGKSTAVNKTFKRLSVANPVDDDEGGSSSGGGGGSSSEEEFDSDQEVKKKAQTTQRRSKNPFAISKQSKGKEKIDVTLNADESDDEVEFQEFKTVAQQKKSAAYRHPSDMLKGFQTGSVKKSTKVKTADKKQEGTPTKQKRNPADTIVVENNDDDEGDADATTDTVKPATSSLFNDFRATVEETSPPNSKRRRT